MPSTVQAFSSQLEHLQKLLWESWRGRLVFGKRDLSTITIRKYTLREKRYIEKSDLSKISYLISYLVLHKVCRTIFWPNLDSTKSISRHYLLVSTEKSKTKVNNVLYIKIFVSQIDNSIIHIWLPMKIINGQKFFLLKC